MQGRDPSQHPTVLLPETVSATQLLLTGPVMESRNYKENSVPRTQQQRGQGCMDGKANK